MKELRVRLLILFTITGSIITAGYFDDRAPETYVLTESHLILRPDQIEEAPQSMVASVESDELTPPIEELEPTVAVEIARVEPEAVAPTEEVSNGETLETTEQEEVAYFGPTKLGEKRRLKTYIATAGEAPVPAAAPVAALPTAAPVPAAATVAKAESLNLKPVSVFSRAPASASARPALTASASSAPRVAISKARPEPLPCALAIESPNGGEELSQSVNERVLWKSSGAAGSIRVKLMKGEEDLGTLTLVRDDGSTLIRIPDLIEPGPGYRLRIEAAQDPLCFDESDAEFSIKP